MTTYFVRLTFIVGVVIGLQCVVALGVTPLASATSDPDLPSVPSTIQVPDGHEVFFKGRAIGTQNFICIATSDGTTWRFTGPQATLFVPLDQKVSKQVATHFLSANPGENGMPRPTWQHSSDTSSVWGRVRPGGSSSDPNYVAPGAIPWLLLEVAGRQLGPTGGDTLTPATFIQRVNTVGGLAPAAGCSKRSDVGVVALVPYSADYFFYKPTPPTP